MMTVTLEGGEMMIEDATIETDGHHLLKMALVRRMIREEVAVQIRWALRKVEGSHLLKIGNNVATMEERTRDVRAKVLMIRVLKMAAIVEMVTQIKSNNSLRVARIMALIGLKTKAQVVRAKEETNLLRNLNCR